MVDGWTKVINHRTGKVESVSINGLKLLANAIVKEACVDYIRPYCRERNSIEKFILSDYGKVLLRDCTMPESIINHLRKQVERSG